MNYSCGSKPVNQVKLNSNTLNVVYVKNNDLIRKDMRPEGYETKFDSSLGGEKLEALVHHKLI